MGTEKNLLDGLKRKNVGVSEGFVIEIDESNKVGILKRSSTT